jgi:hypothetical protein
MYLATNSLCSIQFQNSIEGDLDNGRIDGKEKREDRWHYIQVEDDETCRQLKDRSIN